MLSGYGQSGTDHDFFAFNSDGEVWNGTAFVEWNDADYQDYRIAATEVGTSGRFTAAAPADTSRYDLRERGATLEESFVVWEDTVQLGALTPEQQAQLNAIEAKTALIGSGIVTVTSPIASDLSVSIIRGDDYAAADGRALDWTNVDGTWPDLTNAEITLTVKRHRGSFTVIEATGSVVNPSGEDQQVRVELTDEDTGVAPDQYVYDVQATLSSGSIVTLASGPFEVTEDRTT